MRRLVDEALNPPPLRGDGGGSPSSASSSTPSTSATPSDPAETPAPDPDEDPVDDVEDACAYDPEQAAEAREEGEPPSLYGDGG
jgi:hypothetical protein